MLTNINPLFVKLINVLSQEANKIFNHPINKATFKVHFLKIKFEKNKLEIGNIAKINKLFIEMNVFEILYYLEI